METQFTKTPLSALVPQVCIIAKDQKVNLLNIGHRIADGAVRHSAFGEKGKPAIAAIKAGNALPLAQLRRLHSSSDSGIRETHSSKPRACCPPRFAPRMSKC